MDEQLSGEGPHTWDGGGAGQAAIVTWSGGAISGWFGADTPDGRGPDARYYLRLPNGTQVTAGMAVRRNGAEYEAVQS